jgi:PAS domain S-box-containing protein
MMRRRMTLRRRTLLVFGLAMLAVVGTLWVLARYTLLTAFAERERREVEQRLRQVQNIYQAELDRMGLQVEDYSAWDETYAFMASRDPAFLRQLPSATTTAFQIHFVALLDDQGGLVFGRALDLTQHTDAGLSAEVVALLVRERPRFLAPKGGAGLLRLPEGPALVAVRPILDTERSAPSRGLMLFGRFFDEELRLQLSRAADLPLQLRPAAAADGLSAAQPVAARPASDTQIDGLALLSDLGGAPTLVLSARLPRPVYLQARRTLRYLTLATGVVGLLGSALGLLLIESVALSRLRRLAENAERVGSTGDLSSRLPLAGSDELTALAAALNRMLDALAASQERLRQSEARLRGIVEHSTNLFFSRSPDHTLTYMSPQARTFLEIDPEAAASWSDLVTENPANATALASAQKAIESGEPQPAYEVELRGPTGRRIWVKVNEAPVVENGRTVAIVGSLTDITETNRLEDQLRQAQKMEAVGRLAGGVAHDFNNMLGVIGGFAELVVKELGPDHPSQRRLAQILRTTERAATLTRQLLVFGRKHVLQPRLVDLNDVVGGVDRMLRRLIGEDIQFVTVFGVGPVHVQADPSQVEQALMNLAVNARDAMPRGGRLMIETSVVAVDARPAKGSRVDDVPPGEYVMLSVRDTGHGMDPETQKYIFEPFFTTKDVGKGTGLGLSTVFSIVEQSEGHIRVESAVGKGTEFRLYFPRVKPPQPARAADDSPRPQAPGGTETILLVEDEDALREMVREVLADAGYDIVVAGGPEAALPLAARHPAPIELLVTDVVMPQMSGREMAARLKLAHPELRVLYISGYTDDALGPHGVLGTGVHLLNKPFSGDALLAAVREVLDGTGPQQV